MFGRSDWRHIDDYDPDHANWLDVSVVCSPYQLQLDLVRHNHWRHRDIQNYGKWIEGPAPAKTVPLALSRGATYT